MRFLSDFHVHSTFSDGKLTVPEVVDFYGSRGFGAIAITDHACDSHPLLGRGARWLDKTLTPATFPIYQAILESERLRAWVRYRMLVIPGIELTRNALTNDRSCHMLGLGVREWINPHQDALHLARSIRAQGGLAIAAHPVHTRKSEKQALHLWGRREELRSELDAWEVASGPHYFDEVAGARLPLIATSDFHRPEHIHAWKTALECERSETAVLQAIRAQDLEFVFFHERDAHDGFDRCRSFFAMAY